MRTVSLPFGAGTAVVSVPDGTTVVEPTFEKALVDPSGAVAASLSNPWSGPPLEDLVSSSDRVAVVIPDHTRPMPHRVVLPPLLDALARAGVGSDQVTLLCATGTHAPPPEGEMEALVGSDVAVRVPISVHRAELDPHEEVGTVDGVPILLDQRYVDATVRITTGFVEPHFFAGYSGGPKGVCPGLAATETTLEAHSTVRIADAAATWMRCEGNPVHDFVRAAVSLCPPNLSVDVTTDRTGQVTGVFTGPLPGGHELACRHVATHSVVSVPRRFPVVITTNGGHPLDRNLYQAVKGMAAAERVVADGGIIIVAAACGDGVPGGEAFARILAASERPADLCAGSPNGGPTEQDRWQAQVLGRVLARAEVWLYSDGVSAKDARAAHLRPVEDLQAAVEEALASAARAADSCTDPGDLVCVLVHGPLVVASPPTP